MAVKPEIDVDKWIAGTLDLSLEEEGAYWRLCAFMYARSGPLADIDAEVARLLKLSARRWKTIREALVTRHRKVVAQDGLLIVPRVMADLEAMAKKSSDQAAKVRKRWEIERARVNETNHLADTTVLQSPSTVSKPRNCSEKSRLNGSNSDHELNEINDMSNTNARARARTPLLDRIEVVDTGVPPIVPQAEELIETWFEEWWTIYPRRIGKGAARKAYAKAVRSVPRSRLLEAATAYAVTREGEDQNFTPHPSTWLNQERWNDEPEAPRQDTPGPNQRRPGGSRPSAHSGLLAAGLALASGFAGEDGDGEPVDEQG